MKIQRTFASVLSGFALFLSIGTGVSQIFVTNPNGIASSDQLTWSGFGDDHFFSNPFQASSKNGTVVTFMESGSDPYISTIYQAPVVGSGGGLNGNFTPSTLVLDVYYGSTITLSFPNGIYGGGAQFAVPTTTPSGAGPFTAQIVAYGQNNNLLATFSGSGNFSAAADNSAPFFGILDSTPDIYSISFTGLTAHYSTYLGNFEFFAPAPEPATLSLVGPGLLALLAMKRKRTRSKGVSPDYS
jgi:hypothetical protein